MSQQYTATVSTLRGGWVSIEAEPSPKPADAPPAYTYGAFGNYEPNIATLTVTADFGGEGLGGAPPASAALHLTRAQLRELSEAAQRALAFDAFVKGIG